MSFCSNCGAQVDDTALVCVKCGAQVTAVRGVNDAPSTGFGVLGFFFPVVGLILYLVWKDQTPLKAKSAGKGALIGVIVSVVGSCLYAVLIASLLSSSY